MTEQMEAYYKKKIELLEEQCKAYQELVDIQKTDIVNLIKQLEISEIVIKKQEEIIEIGKVIDSLEEKKSEYILKHIEKN